MTVRQSPIETSALQQESEYFDNAIQHAGDFNPFADRGSKTIAKRFSQMVPLAGGFRLLDVGCGSGQSRQLYTQKCQIYVGVDLSLQALRRSDGKFPEPFGGRADASRLPFMDGCFDVVAFSSVLHHIEEFQQPLREAYRVLPPGGYVFAFDPNLLHPGMALFRHPRRFLYSPKGVSPNERPLLRRSLSVAFQEAGFVKIRQRCQAAIPYRAVAPTLLDGLLPFYNFCDRVMEVVGLGRWFGSFVLTAGQKSES